MTRHVKKRRLKKWVRKFLRRSFLLFITVLTLFIIYKIEYKKVSIKDIYLENNKLYIKFNSKINKDITCALSKEKNISSVKDTEWIKIKDKECVFNFSDDNSNLFIKKNDKLIYSSNDSKVLDFEFDDATKYYAVNNEYKLNYKYKYIGNNPKITWKSSNDKIITVDNGTIKTISDGEVSIFANFEGKSKKLDITSTSLITAIPKEYDYKKKYLPCDKYTEEENDKLDEILDYRVHQVGFQTRAAAAEAARFLTLELPYRINYFYETGRLTQANKIDGEGRYYHVGLYLNSSRYKSISKSTSKPKIWGCSMYDTPVHRNVDNGLDCSGFVSWALLNAGFDVGDLGAGVSNVKNLSQSLGEFKDSSTSLAKKLKVGDLLFSYRAGGHIGILVGIDDNYFYTAQALWTGQIGVIITKATASELAKEFPKFVLMDKFYKEDGELTNMWY
ncbi:MAG: C40 family peptidase [Bacilli bacterium]|nr:C40 family peptidase [Bacilli bacterium]